MTNKLRKLFVGLSVLLMLLAFFIYKFINSSNLQLQASVQHLLQKELGLAHYEVNKHKGSESFVDLGGEWAVQLNMALSDLNLAPNLYQRSDRSDLEHFKTVVKKRLEPKENLDGFELFRAEIPLGADSICEVSKCNIYLLFKPGNKNLYVGIYKN